MPRLLLAIPVLMLALASCKKQETPPPQTTAPVETAPPQTTTPATPPAAGTETPAPSGTASGTAGSSTTTQPPSSATDSSASPPSASTSAPTPPTGTTDSSSTGASSSGASSASVAAGKAIYDKTCVACHSIGAAGAPMLTNAADWKTRAAQGKETLYTHAINGFTGAKGQMPAKGGNASLSEADVKAAVDYMVATATK